MTRVPAALGARWPTRDRACWRDDARRDDGPGGGDVSPWRAGFRAGRTWCWRESRCAPYLLAQFPVGLEDAAGIVADAWNGARLFIIQGWQVETSLSVMDWRTA